MRLPPSPGIPLAPSTARTVRQAGPTFSPKSDAARLPVRSDTLDFGFYQTIGGQDYAVQGESWTWDHGAADPLEGWRALDGTPGIFIRRITPAIWSADPLNPSPAPIPSGTGSIWVGLFATPARDSCYANGLGYGNEWRQRLVSSWLTYDGSGNVTLSFTYFNDTEPSYDFTRIVLENGTGGQLVLNGTGFNQTIGPPPSGPWAVYSRVISNYELGGGSQQLQFRILVEFLSDATASDQDGYQVDTAWGGFGVDDISLQNNMIPGNVLYTFETGMDGWTAENMEGPPGLCGVAPLVN